MIALRVLAPVAVDVFAVPGTALRDPERYARFWASQQAAVSGLAGTLAPPGIPAPEITLEHTVAGSSLNLYRTIDAHAAARVPHLLSGRLQPGHLDDDALASDISFRVFDHGIMVLEFLIDAEAFLGGHAGPDETALADLERESIALGERFAEQITRRYLDPVMRLLREGDRAQRILLPATPADNPLAHDWGKTLWVTRSLILSRRHRGARGILEHWIKDAVPGEERTHVDALLGDGPHHLIRWLNYAFVDDSAAAEQMQPGGPFDDEWEALRYAQVFYGSLDRIDVRLSKILADTAAAPSRWRLEQLRGDLLSLSQRAELILMERQDLSKYLKRSVRAELDEILAFWNYEGLLQSPVEAKIATCDRRLAELTARRTARSSLFTDLILLGIAVTSILGTALAVTQFGRDTLSSSSSAGYDIGQSSIIEWFAAQPADAVLSASAAVSVLLAVTYLFFRRDNR